MDTSFTWKYSTAAAPAPFLTREERAVKAESPAANTVVVVAASTALAANVGEAARANRSRQGEDVETSLEVR